MTQYSCTMMVLHSRLPGAGAVAVPKNDCLSLKDADRPLGTRVNTGRLSSGVSG